jgi:dihydrofolate reductase
MRPLRYSLNISLDGCYDHQMMDGNEDTHRHATGAMERADAILFGRITYGMMESAWRFAPDGSPPAWITGGGQATAYMLPFARKMDATKKYVVSRTLERVDWNSELVRDDLEQTVRTLKAEPGNGLFVAGVQLALALTELGLIDEYELMVHPIIVGRGPTLFAGLTKKVALKLVDRTEFKTGATVLRYVRTDSASPA